MEELTIEEVTGRLKAAENRFAARAAKAAAAVATSKLLLAEQPLQLRARIGCARGGILWRACDNPHRKYRTII
jgi:hypothetical protein